jgi:hypothetical protein
MKPEEAKIYYKDYYQKNKEKNNNNSSKYYYANIDKLKEYYKAYSVSYYKTHREERLSYQREYYKNNGSTYYQDNKEAILKKKKELYHTTSNIKSSCQAKTNNIIKAIEKEKEKAEAFKATLYHLP